MRGSADCTIRALSTKSTALAQTTKGVHPDPRRQAGLWSASCDVSRLVTVTTGSRPQGGGVCGEGGAGVIGDRGFGFSAKLSKTGIYLILFKRVFSALFSCPDFGQLPGVLISDAKRPDM